MIFAFLRIRSRQRKRCAAEALRVACRPGRVLPSTRLRVPRHAPHSRSLMHVKRRRVSVSHCCPTASSTAGAHHKYEIQEWPFPGVSFASALGGAFDLGSVSDLCRTQMRIPKPRILAILRVRTRQRKPLRGACCCAGPAGQKK